VTSFAEGLTEHLFRFGAKAVVMACNISSAIALHRAQRRFGESRVFGTIGPGARAAIRVRRTNKIAVLATVGTTSTRAYSKTLSTMEPEINAIEIACPEFVPLVEAGEVASTRAIAAAEAYVAPLAANGVDTIVLGCTHYPFLLETLARAAPRAHFVDPAKETVSELKEALAKLGLLNRGPRTHAHRFMTTGDRAAFEAQLLRFFGERSSAESLSWNAIREL
jgi:glutamate racemase